MIGMRRLSTTGRLMLFLMALLALAIAAWCG